MARLPNVTDLGSRPTPSPSGVAGVPMPSDTAETALAKEISQISDVMREIAEYNDKIAAEDAQNQLMVQSNELSNGENGFSQIKSGNVMKQQVYKNYSDRFNEAVNQISSSLGNDAQRRMFQRRADVVKIQYGNDLTNHIQKEQDAYFKQTVEGGKAIEKQNAVSHWNEPGSIKLAIERTNHLISLESKKYGMPSVAVKALKLSAESDIHEGVIDQAVSNQNPEYAKTYFEKYKKNIDATVHDEITKLIRGSELNVLSQEVANETMAIGMDEKSALQEIRKKYKGDEEEAIISAVKTRYIEQRRAIDQSKSDATDAAWQEFNNARDAGHPDPYSQVSPVNLEKMDQNSRSVLKAKSEGKQFKSGGSDYYYLRMLASTDPATFRDSGKTNILGYKLSEADAKELIKLQTEPQEIDYFDTELSIVNSGLRSMGVDKKDLDKDNNDGDRGRAFMNEVRKRQKAYQLTTGKKMDDDKLQETVDKMTIEVIRKRKPLFGETIHDWTNPDFLPDWMTEPMGDTKIPAFESEIENVPQEVIPDIAARIRRAKIGTIEEGNPPTENEILRVYNADQARNR
jgi:hypothetical protein